MLRFLEGRALKVFLAPGGLAARLFGRGTGLVFAIFARVTGVDMLGELSTLLQVAVGRDRRLQRADPRRRRAAARPGDELPDRHLPRARARARGRCSWPSGCARRGWRATRAIVNRVHLHGLGGHSAEEVAGTLASELGEALARRAAHNLADFDVLARRDRDTIADLGSELDEPAPVIVPHLDEDIQDLAGLARIAGYLFA